MQDIHIKQMLSIPRPMCCEAAKTHPAITLSVDDGNDSNTGTARWYITLNDAIVRAIFSERKDQWYNNIPEPKFCPYCGTPLPKMVRKNPMPEGICRITDGGYYCDTCGKRGDNCTCLPPSAAFEEEK